MTELNQTTVVDYTIKQLRKAIGSGRFAPGQRLIVSDIVQMFSVSAAPVRELDLRLQHINVGCGLRLPLCDENAAYADHRADGNGPGDRFVEEDHARGYRESEAEQTTPPFPSNTVRGGETIRQIR